MASEETTKVDDVADVEAGAEAVDDAAQAEMDWGDSLIEDFKPIPVNLGGNGEVAEEAETDTKDEVEADATETDDKSPDFDFIGEADYANNKVEIKADDGSVSYKTVKQLIDEGMYEKDYRQKTSEVARQREQLSEDQSLLKMLDNDEHARDYLMKRLDDIKAGKSVDTADDLDIPQDVIDAAPWIGKLRDKVMKNDIEASKSRTNREQAQADQTVGKIGSVMDAAMTAVAKETGLKLEPEAFRTRVGKNIIESLSDSVPQDRKVSVVGNMILADKDYYLSKARASYQPEIELAKEQAIDTAKQDRAKKAQKTKPLKGSGASAPSGGSAEFKMVKDAQGRPDLDAFLIDAHTRSGKTG